MIDMASNQPPHSEMVAWYTMLAGPIAMISSPNPIGYHEPDSKGFQDLASTIGLAGAACRGALNRYNTKNPAGIKTRAAKKPWGWGNWSVISRRPNDTTRCTTALRRVASPQFS